MYIVFLINEKKCIVCIYQDFLILYRILHNIVISWFQVADTSGPFTGKPESIKLGSMRLKVSRSLVDAS